LEMISCLGFRENMSAYIDDELNEVERLSFEEHIRDCRDCERELDEMTRIIGIYTSVPQLELPADFHAELHDKLLTVADRKAKKDSSIQKTKNFFFSKTFASIAAAALLIFLGGTFVRFGLFSSKMAADSAMAPAAKGMATEEADAEAEADSFSMAQAASEDAGESKADMSEPLHMDDGSTGDYNSAGDDAVGFRSIDNGSGTVEVDRSGTIEGRKAALSMAEMPKSEMFYNRMATITVTADELADVAEKVRLIAIENNGEEIEEAQQALSDTLKGAEEIAIQDNEAVSYSTVEQIPTQIVFVFSQTQYERFVNDLGDTLGAANIHMGAFVSEDMTDTVNSMIEESEQIGLQLQELQNKEKAGTDEIAMLKQLKEEIDGQVEIVRLGSDFVTVTLTINPK